MGTLDTDSVRKAELRMIETLFTGATTAEGVGACSGLCWGLAALGGTFKAVLADRFEILSTVV